jgi:hypothetical protein
MMIICKYCEYKNNNYLGNKESIFWKCEKMIKLYKMSFASDPYFFKLSRYMVVLKPITS